jgi:hypothetical protein
MRHLILSLAVLALSAGCDDMDLATQGGAAGHDQGPRDAGPDRGPACADPQIQLTDGRCIPPPPAERAERCGWLTLHGLDCTDFDGDCYVLDCRGPVPAELLDALIDCDDRRPDVWPGAPELCDEVDNNCDGATDEDFGVGLGCDACGFEGKFECAVDDPSTARCDTHLGQSSAEQGPSQLPEICDGEDQDCDGLIDEGCALLAAAPDAGRSWPTLCAPDHLLWTEGGRVWSLHTEPLGEPVALSAAAFEPATAPSCHGPNAAWIHAEPDTCQAPDDGPWRCTGGHLIVATEASTYDLTGRASPGAPVVGPDDLTWHDANGAPLLNSHIFDTPGRAALFEDADLSDPTPWVDQQLAARQWFETGPRISLRTDDGTAQLLDAGDDAVGPPTLGGRWLIWSVGDGAALWATDLSDDEPLGFQLTSEPGPHRRPQLLGDTVVWSAAGRLRAFDLISGTQRTLAAPLESPAHFAVGHGQIVWFDAQGALRRERLP